MESNAKKLQRMQNKMNKIKAFFELTRKDTTAAIEKPQDVAKPRREIPSDELDHLRARLRAQQKEKLSRPLLFQTHVPNLIGPADVRQLIMYSLEGGNASGLKPTWCTLVRWMKVSQVVVIAVDNMTSEDFDSYSEDFPFLKSFLDVWSLLESQERGTLAKSLLEYPLSSRAFDRFSRSRMSKMVVNGDINMEYKEDDGLLQNLKVLGDNPAGIEFSRLHLLMSIERMALERYPVPTFCKEVDIGHFVPTKDIYEPVRKESPLFAVDCEMCMTTSKKSELTRISIVNENLQVVYDTYVKPYNLVTNYLTKFSGITKAILDPVKTRLHDVQQAIRKILPPDAILCGQSLNGDLQALEMIHPYVIDTSVIYNLKGNPRAKSSLKILSKMFLSKDIQESEKKGHDSVEDSRTTMELVLLKLRNGHAFGDVTRGWRFPTAEAAVEAATDEAPAMNGEEPAKSATLHFPLKRKAEETNRQFTPDTPLSSCYYLQSLLACAKRANKPAVIIGNGEYFERSAEKMMEYRYLSSSKAIVKMLTDSIPDHSFLFASVAAKQSDMPEKQKSHTEALLRRISRAFSAVADRALCILVLGGNYSESLQVQGICRAGVKGLDTGLNEKDTTEVVSDPD